MDKGAVGIDILVERVLLDLGILPGACWDSDPSGGQTHRRNNPGLGELRSDVTPGMSQQDMQWVPEIGRLPTCPTAHSPAEAIQVVCDKEAECCRSPWPRDSLPPSREQLRRAWRSEPLSYSPELAVVLEIQRGRPASPKGGPRAAFYRCDGVAHTGLAQCSLSLGTSLPPGD